MEIDLYTDLAAFNALSPEEQQEEAERLRAAAAVPEPEPPLPPPPPAPRPQMARVMVAPGAAFAGQVMADTPGSVILRAEDILPEDDEPEPEPVPKPEPKAVLISEPQPAIKFPESTGRKVKMDDQLKVSGPLVDIGVPVSKSDSGLIVCPACGSRSNPQDLFCIGCGSFLTEPEVPEVEVVGAPACSDCGASVEPEEIFCPSCGSALSS